MKRSVARKNKKFSKFIVVLVIVLNILFTAAALVVHWHTGSEPSTLETAWFAFTTGELWLLARIEINKNKKDDNND